MSEQIQWQLLGVYLLGVAICAFTRGVVRQLRPRCWFGQGDGSAPFFWPAFIAFAVMSVPAFVIIGLVYLPTKAGEWAVKVLKDNPDE